MRWLKRFKHFFFRFSAAARRAVSKALVWLGKAFVYVVFGFFATVSILPNFETLLDDDVSDYDKSILGLYLTLCIFFWALIIIIFVAVRQVLLELYERTSAMEHRTVISSIEKSADLLSTWRHTEGGGGENGKDHAPCVDARVAGMQILRITSFAYPSYLTEVFDIVCAYLQTRCPKQEGSHSSVPDVQAALDIITSVPRSIDGSNLRLFLKLDYTNLDFAYFSRIHLSPCRFSNCSFVGSEFISVNHEVEGKQIFTSHFCDFSSSSFVEANLAGSHWELSKLCHCNFNEAHLSGALIVDNRLDWSYFSGTDFSDALVRGCSFRGSSLVFANGLTFEMLRSNFGVASGIGATALPAGLSAPDHWFNAKESESDSEDHRSAYEAAYLDWLRDGGGTYVRI